MSQRNLYNIMMTETTNSQYRNTLLKLHKCQQHIDFLTICLEKSPNLLPKFTTLHYKVKESLQLNSHQVQKHREEKLRKAFDEQKNTILELEQKRTWQYKNLLKFKSFYEVNKLV